MIVLGVSGASAAVLPFFRDKRKLVIASTAVVVGAGLIVSLKNKNDLKTKARNYEYFFNRDQNKYELADYKEAILFYNKALELSPAESCLVY